MIWRKRRWWIMSDGALLIPALWRRRTYVLLRSIISFGILHVDSNCNENEKCEREKRRTVSKHFSLWMESFHFWFSQSGGNINIVYVFASHMLFIVYDFPIFFFSSFLPYMHWLATCLVCKNMLCIWWCCVCRRIVLVFGLLWPEQAVRKDSHWKRFNWQRKEKWNEIVLE